MSLFRRILPGVVAVIVVASAATWTGVSGAFSAKSVSSGSADCIGTLAPGTYHDIEVPSGKTCTIDNSVVIAHDVKVETNAIFNDAGASIGHDLIAEEGSQIHVAPSSGYAGTTPTIGHDLVVEGSGDDRDNKERGDRQVAHADDGEDAAVQVSSTKIGHDLRVVNTEGPVSITDNSIGHDLHVQDNSGPTTVTGNTVGRDADCKDNAGFVGGGNTAGHKNTCNGASTDGDGDGESRSHVGGD